MWDDDAELRALFHDEVSERTHRLVEGGRAMTTGPLDAERLVSLVRDAHTVKGSSGVMGFGALARGAEALEEVWKGLHEGAITSVPELGEALARVAASLKEASDSHQTEGTPELTDAVEDLRALLASASGQRAWRETGQEAVPRPVAPVPPSPSSDRAPPQSASHSPDLGGLLSTLQAEVVEEAASIESTRLYRLINRSAEARVDARALRETVSALRMAAASSPREVASLAFRWEQAVEALEQTVEDLQRQAMALAATPLSEITDAFPRLLRYLARKTDKHVRLTLVGDEVEADRQVLERIAEPLRHLVVNAIEHGIEAPGEREKARKPSTGEVSVRAKVLEGRLSIVVEDDGRGVDWALVEDRAKGRGLLDQDSRPSEEELSSLLFREGFSTSLAQTEFSGDGTGLARLAEAVEALNGGLHLRSFPGRGTRLELTVPAWWALQDALLVRAGGHQWGIPAPAVAEAFPLSLADIRPGEERMELHWDGNALPLASLAGAVGLAEDELVTEVVVLATRAGMVGLTVPEVLGSRQMAIKALGPLLAGTPHLTGAAVLGGAEVVVMVEPNRLAERVRSLPSPAGPRPRVLVVDDSPGVRQLVAATLASHGFQTMVAEGARQALRRLASEDVHALVVDYSMPGSSGVELVADVREVASELPIIMVSGVAKREDQRRALQAGVDAYFDKSDLRQGVLAATLHSLIESRMRSQVQVDR